jgi:hypothetical protein
VLEMNRADLSNRLFIVNNKLASAPVPLIVLIASNGVVAGGLPAEQAQPEMLVKMIPSTGKAEIIKALSEGKAVFVVASRTTMVDRLKVVETCKNASKELKDKAVSVLIDMDDKKESAFLEQLKVDKAATTPATYVINSQGQVTENFAGPVEVAKLTKAATTAKKSSCCPGGSPAPGSKGCAVPPKR